MRRRHLHILFFTCFSFVVGNCPGNVPGNIPGTVPGTAAPPLEGAQQDEKIVKAPAIGAEGEGGGVTKTTPLEAFSLTAEGGDPSIRGEENVAEGDNTADDQPIPAEDVVVAGLSDISCAPVVGAEDGESEGVAGDMEAGDRPADGDSESVSGSDVGRLVGSRDSDFDGVLASYLEGSIGEGGGSLLMPLGGLRLLRYVRVRGWRRLFVFLLFSVLGSDFFWLVLMGFLFLFFCLVVVACNFFFAVFKLSVSGCLSNGLIVV